MKYIFEDVVCCVMCGDNIVNHKILGQRLNKSQGLDPKNKFGITVSILKCEKCGLIYSNPLPIPINIQDHYGVPVEEYWKPEYFVWEPDYFSEQIETTKRLLFFKNGMKALDIGCGLGKCLTSLYNAGFDAYGIESSVPFYQKAISEMNIQPDRIKLGLMQEVEYQEKFDFITFGAVLEHLYHPAEALEKALKWLDKNGVIHIEVPSSNHFIPKLINLYYKFRCSGYVTHLSPMHSPFHLYEFDLESFRYLSKKMGFEIVEYRYDVCSIYYIPKIFHPLLSWYMKTTNTGMQLTVYLRKI